MWSKIFGWGSPAGVGVAMMALPETGWLPQDKAIVVFWIGTIVAVISFAGLGWTTIISARPDWLPVWIPVWRVNRDGLWPFHRLISMHDAAQYAYPKIKTRTDFKVIEHLNKNPDELPAIVAGFLIDRANSPIPIFGSRPPFKLIEAIPDDAANKFKFSDDARELIDRYDERNRYVNIAIRRRDLKRRINELKG